MIFAGWRLRPDPAYNDSPRARASIAPPGKKKPEILSGFFVISPADPAWRRRQGLTGRYPSRQGRRPSPCPRRCRNAFCAAPGWRPSPSGGQSAAADPGKRSGCRRRHCVFRRRDPASGRSSLSEPLDEFRVFNQRHAQIDFGEIVKGDGLLNRIVRQRTDDRRRGGFHLFFRSFYQGFHLLHLDTVVQRLERIDLMRQQRLLNGVPAQFAVEGTLPHARPAAAGPASARSSAHGTYSGP